jgi:hypothetical protein
LAAKASLFDDDGGCFVLAVARLRAAAASFKLGSVRSSGGAAAVVAAPAPAAPAAAPDAPGAGGGRRSPGTRNTARPMSRDEEMFFCVIGSDPPLSASVRVLILVCIYYIYGAS